MICHQQQLQLQLRSPQNLVDKVMLGRYVEIRDLLMDDAYVLGQLDILGDPHVPSGLPVRQQAGFDPLIERVSS